MWSVTEAEANHAIISTPVKKAMFSHGGVHEIVVWIQNVFRKWPCKATVKSRFSSSILTTILYSIAPDPVDEASDEGAGATFG